MIQLIRPAFSSRRKVWVSIFGPTPGRGGLQVGEPFRSVFEGAVAFGFDSTELPQLRFLCCGSGHLERVSVLTTAKTVTVKVGRAERRVVRLQRRVWLAQMLMWPTLLVVSAVGAVVLVSAWRARRTPTPATLAEPSGPSGDHQLG